MTRNTPRRSRVQTRHTSRVSRRLGVSRTRRSRAKIIRGGSRRSKRAEKHTRGGVDYKKVAALGTAAVVAGLGLRALTRRTKRRAPLPEGPVMELFRSLHKAKDGDSPKDFIEFLNSVLEAVVQPCKKAENGEAEFVQQLKDAARTKVDSEPPSEDRDELLTELEASENYYALLTAFRTRDTSAVGHLNEDELSNLISEVAHKFTEVTPYTFFHQKLNFHVLLQNFTLARDELLVCRAAINVSTQQKNNFCRAVARSPTPHNFATSRRHFSLLIFLVHDPRER
jgi:hypothetical protein